MRLTNWGKFCTVWIISLPKFTQIPKLTYMILSKVFLQIVSFGGCLSKKWQPFIVYMFWQPSEVFISVSNNGLISGFGKAPIGSLLLNYTINIPFCKSISFNALFTSRYSALGITRLLPSLSAPNAASRRVLSFAINLIKDKQLRTVL